MSYVTAMHIYQEMKEDMRPQDPNLDGAGLKFETLEHGGEYPDTMPQAVRLTDAEGCTCVYLPTKVDGKVVDSIKFRYTESDTHPDDESGRPPPPPVGMGSDPVIWPFIRRLFRRR